MAIYYQEIQTSKLTNSPQFQDTFNYKQYIDGELTEEKLNALDIYYDGKVMLKNFTMDVDGKSVVVQWRMSANSLIGSEHDYEIVPRGIAISRDTDEFIKGVCNAFGYDVKDSTIEDIKTSKFVEIHDLVSDIDETDNLIKGIIDKYGRSSYDYRLMDVIHNYFEQFPNINNPYTVLQKPLPTGENFITNYDHTDFINNNAGSNNNGNLTSTFTPKQLKNALDYLKENDSLFADIISNSQVVRIGYRNIAPQIVRMYVNGYTLDNAKIVTSNEDGINQHYSGLVKHVKGCMWATNPDYGDLNFHRESEMWEQNKSIGTIFYNYPKDAWLSNQGLTDSAVLLAKWYDSIGSTTIGSSITPISPTHTKWYTSEGYQPVGDNPTPGTEPTIEIQTIIRKGTPRIIYIPPNPIEGSTPVPPIDEPSEETQDKLPSGKFGGYNVFHPTDVELKDFFGWLWDRDTWTDKQALSNNPMETIISLHTLPIPNRLIVLDDHGQEIEGYWYDQSQNEPIVLGYLPAVNENEQPITATIVPNKYVKMKFGSVLIPRTYGDYRDFDREIYIFLPYIGFRQLRCDDVTAYKGYFSTVVSLDYVIDITTGDFVAQITIDKNVKDKKLLYTFNGNMATEIPLTATDKTRLAQARMSLISSIGATALSVIGTGGMALAGASNPVIAGGVLATLASAGGIFKNARDLTSQNTISVERSSSLSSNYGAMSSLTPFVVINSPIAYDTNYKPYGGDCANVTIQLGQLKGWTRCKAVHVDVMNYITQSEKDEIEKYLLNGVIL